MFALFVALFGLLPPKPGVIVVGELPEPGTKPAAWRLPDPVAAVGRVHAVTSAEHRTTVQAEGVTFSSFWPAFQTETRSEARGTLFAYAGNSFGQIGTVDYGDLTFARTAYRVREPLTRTWSFSAHVRVPAEDRVVRVAAETASGRVVELFAETERTADLLPVRRTSPAAPTFASWIYATATAGPPREVPKQVFAFTNAPFGGE